MAFPSNLSLSLCEAHDTRGLKALPLNLPPGSTVYADAGYTDYQAEDDIQETEGISLAIMRKKRCDPSEVVLEDIPLRLSPTRASSASSL